MSGIKLREKRRKGFLPHPSQIAPWQEGTKGVCRDIGKTTASVLSLTLLVRRFLAVIPAQRGIQNSLFFKDNEFPITTPGMKINRFF
jgi:hypothetical protein